MFLGADVGFGRRESLPDFAQVLSQFVDVIVVRANRHQLAVDLAGHSSCSVINGLTDFAHPCQAMADLFTLRAVRPVRDRTLAWVGDANNVAGSLALGCGKLGMRMSMATPAKYQFDDESLAFLRRVVPDLELTVTTDPVAAVRDAVAVYTDVWASMGQEVGARGPVPRLRRIPGQRRAFSHAQKGAVFMHCLPAHRGDEVTDEVIDGPQASSSPRPPTGCTPRRAFSRGCWGRRRTDDG